MSLSIYFSQYTLSTNLDLSLFDIFKNNRKRRLSVDCSSKFSTKRIKQFVEQSKLSETSKLSDSLSVTLKYNEYIGSESLCKEYKELDGIDIVPEEIKDVLNGKWIGNDKINESINNILKKNFLKYLIGCLHSRSDISLYQNCSLELGIHDDGHVLGIPYTNTIEPQIITNMIQELIEECLICDKDLKEIIKQKLKVDIINVILPDILPEPTILYEIHKYEEELKTINKIKEINQQIMDKWRNTLGITKSKLCDLYFKDWSRQKIIDYAIRNNAPQIVLTILKDTTYILDMSNQMITSNKYDKSTPYYYICSWRDEETDIIMKQKPIPVPLPNQRCQKPERIVRNFTKMIPLWIQKYGVKLYVIKITFPKFDNIDLSYVDIRGRIRSCFRTLDKMEEPCCQDIEQVFSSQDN